MKENLIRRTILDSKQFHHPSAGFERTSVLRRCISVGLAARCGVSPYIRLTSFSSQTIRVLTPSGIR